MNNATVLALALLAAACSTPRSEEPAPEPSTSVATETAPLADADATAPPEASPDVMAPAQEDSEPISDSNNNGIEDILDIVEGRSLDENLNGIPDEAEAEWIEAQRDH